MNFNIYYVIKPPPGRPRFRRPPVSFQPLIPRSGEALTRNLDRQPTTDPHSSPSLQGCTMRGGGNYFREVFCWRGCEVKSTFKLGAVCRDEAAVVIE